MGVVAVLLAGCSDSKGQISVEKDVDNMKTQLLALQKQLDETKNELAQNKYVIQELEQVGSKPKVTGESVVNAASLNIRTGPGVEFEPIGTATLNTAVEVVDTSNPLWYKVKINVSNLTAKKEDYSTVYSDQNGDRFIIGSDYVNIIDKLNTSEELYVSSKYLVQNSTLVESTVPADPKNPFVYGLLFYDGSTAKILEEKIWNTMKEALIEKGYDGIEVTYVNRDTYKKDVENGKFDAVESAPGNFASINKNPDKPVLTVFAKTVDETTQKDHYSGIIIVNKNSGINDFEDLKGKKIVTGDTDSESGFKYQNYYLKTQEDINIEEEAQLKRDYSHQEILFLVASGKFDIGFVGDFVMTDPFHELDYAAEAVGVKVQDEQELKRLRDNIYQLPYRATMETIPNNPHAVTSELAKDQGFVDLLKKVVTDVYLNNKEGFDLTNANNEEYEFLKEFE